MFCFWSHGSGFGFLPRQPYGTKGVEIQTQAEKRVDLSTSALVYTAETRSKCQRRGFLPVIICNLIVLAVSVPGLRAQRYSTTCMCNPLYRETQLVQRCGQIDLLDLKKELLYSISYWACKCGKCEKMLEKRKINERKKNAYCHAEAERSSPSSWRRVQVTGADYKCRSSFMTIFTTIFVLLWLF